MERLVFIPVFFRFFLWGGWGALVMCLLYAKSHKKYSYTNRYICAHNNNKRYSKLYNSYNNSSPSSQSNMLVANRSASPNSELRLTPPFWSRPIRCLMFAKIAIASSSLISLYLWLNSHPYDYGLWNPQHLLQKALLIFALIELYLIKYASIRREGYARGWSQKQLQQQQQQQ